MPKQQTEKKLVIFRVKPIKNTSSAIVRCLGHVSEEEEVNDEPIECSDIPENKFEYPIKINDILTAKFFRPSITGAYLMTTDTLPVLCCTVIYRTNLYGGVLLNIIIEFKIEKDIKTEKQLIDNTIVGKYQLTIKRDNKEPKILELDNYTSDKFTMETIKTLLETEEMGSLYKELLEERRLERVEKYGEVKTDINKPKYNFNKLVEEYMKTKQINLPE
jgi:hypothetical protein